MAIYEIQRRTTAIEQIEQSLYALTIQYSHQLGNEIFAGQITALGQTLSDIRQRPRVNDITAFDQFGKLVAATGDDIIEDLPHDRLSQISDTHLSIKRRINQKNVLKFLSPINAYGELVGFLEIRYSLLELDRQTWRLVLIFIALIGSIALLIILLLNSILIRFVLTPVEKLHQIMNHIQGQEVSFGSEKNIQKPTGALIRWFRQLRNCLKIHGCQTTQVMKSVLLRIHFIKCLLHLKGRI